MAKSQTCTIMSVSMPRSIERRLTAALPRYGDKSKLVARLLEMWLDREIIATNVYVRRKVDA